MPSGVMLDDLALPLVQAIRAREERTLIAHRVPGLEGAAHQHLGRLPLVVTVSGAAVDDESLATLERVRAKLRGAAPLPFSADIVTATDLRQVIVDDLRVTELAGRPQQYTYTLLLREFIPPPPPVATLDAPGLDADALAGIDQLGEVLGGLPDLGGLLVPDLVDPTPPLRSLLDGLTAVTDGLAATFGPLDALLGA